MAMSCTSSSEHISAKINDEFLTCKICFENYKQPKILNCLHSFCLECLDGFVSGRVSDELECPLCRQVTLISNGVANLRSNFFIVSLQEAMQGRSKVRPCDSCHSRGESKPAKMKCLDCRDLLCEDCFNAHQRLNLTRNHKTVPYEEEKEEEIDVPEDSDTKSSLLFCELHATVPLTMYCLKCLQAICHNCKLEFHTSHKCRDIEASAGEERENMYKLLNFIRFKIFDHDRITTDWNQYEIELEPQKQAVESAMEAHKDLMIQYIEQWHNNSKRELESLYLEEEKNISAKVQQLYTLTTKYRCIMNVADTIVHETNDGVVMEMKSDLRKKLAELQSVNKQSCALNKKFYVKFNGLVLSDDIQLSELVHDFEAVSSQHVNLPIRSLMFQRKFETRPLMRSSRFDASSITITDKEEIVVTDRQLDRIALFNDFGIMTSEIDVSQFGKPVMAVKLHTGDVIMTREKSGLCVFAGDGKHKNTIKDHMISKPASFFVPWNSKTFTVFDYEQRSVQYFSTDDYSRSSLVQLQYATASMWDHIAVTTNGYIYVLSFIDKCLYQFDANGALVRKHGRKGNKVPGELDSPRGMCADAQDNIIIADTNNNRLQVLSPEGEWSILVEPDDLLLGPRDVALTGQGQLCVLDNKGAVTMFQYLP